MDEPTACSRRRATVAFGVVRGLRDTGVDYIRWLDEIFQLADRVTVLRDGECGHTRSGYGCPVAASRNATSPQENSRSSPVQSAAVGSRARP
jgi:ABC-type sugar transport system ATPase subunit